MDDEGLPLVPPLPLSQPAVQAPIDNPDANPASEATRADGGRNAGIRHNPQTARSAAAIPSPGPRAL